MDCKLCGAKNIQSSYGGVDICGMCGGLIPRKQHTYNCECRATAQAERIKELEFKLEAWFIAFGSTQLTHAIDNFEVVKAENAKLTLSLGYSEQANAKLKEQIKELKQGVCKHEKNDELACDCILCESAVAREGYNIAVKKTHTQAESIEFLENYIEILKDGLRRTEKYSKDLQVKLDKVRGIDFEEMVCTATYNCKDCVPTTKNCPIAQVISQSIKGVCDE